MGMPVANIKEFANSPLFESILPLLDAAGDKWAASSNGDETAKAAFVTAWTEAASSIGITYDDLNRCLSCRVAYNKDGSPK